MTDNLEVRDMILNEKDKNDLEARELVLADDIMLKRTDVDTLNKQEEAETKNLYEQIEKLEHQINSIKDRYLAKIQPISNKLYKQEKELGNIRKVLSYYKAQVILKAGITTKKQCVKYIAYSRGWERREIDIKNIREWVHTRGKDIHVWAFKYDISSKMAYIATSKAGRLLSALTVEKAKYVGDETYTKNYGCKLVDGFEDKTKYKSSYRSGICMKEWLDENLVKWVGLDNAGQINFWNNINW